MDYATSFLRLLNETARSGNEENVRSTIAFLQACQDLMTTRVKRLTNGLRGETVAPLEPQVEDVRRAAGRLIGRVPEARTTDVVAMAARDPANPAIQEFLYQLATLN